MATIIITVLVCSLCTLCTRMPVCVAGTCAEIHLEQTLPFVLADVRMSPVDIILSPHIMAVVTPLLVCD